MPSDHEDCSDLQNEFESLASELDEAESKKDEAQRWADNAEFNVEMNCSGDWGNAHGSEELEEGTAGACLAATAASMWHSEEVEEASEEFDRLHDQVASALEALQACYTNSEYGSDWV